MTDFQKFYRNEGDYPQLDGEGACRRLSAAIACRTVNGTEGCDGEFAKLRQLIHESYPAVAAQAVTETVGRSLLIHIEGRDKNLKPVLFMSHMDVVGVEDTMLDDLDTQESHVRVRQLVDECLTDREAEIIKKRYGLDNRKPRTQREIAADYGISRSYV